MGRPTRTGKARRRPARVAQVGFTYLGLMLFIAAMGAVLAVTVQVWATVVQREKERDLLFVGEEFRNALGKYAKGARTSAEKQPKTLDDLVKDPRHPDTRRYLRQIYVDPMTGKREWGLQKDAKGGIVGIFSLSDRKPIKVASFAKRDLDFVGKAKYSEWVFVARPDSKSRFRDAVGVGQPGTDEVQDNEVRKAIDADILNQFLKGAPLPQQQQQGDAGAR